MTQMNEMTVNTRFILDVLGCSYQTLCRLKNSESDFPESVRREPDGLHFRLADVIRFATRYAAKKAMRGRK